MLIQFYKLTKLELKIKLDMALFNINGARSCIVTDEFLIREVNIT